MPARKVPRSIHENARDVARDIARTQAYVTSRRERKKIEMADIYWLNAQREILTTSVESSGSNAAAAAPADAGLVATKSAKKARVARSGKSKTRAA